MPRLADEVPLDVLLEREVGVPVRDGNAIDLIENGAIFDALEEEIRGAIVDDLQRAFDHGWQNEARPERPRGRN